jgi:hypothetical protein
MSDRERNPGYDDTPRMMREALGVAAKKTLELDDAERSGKFDGLLMLPAGEIPADTTPEKSSAIIPEVSEQARDRLLANLNLSPFDRESIHQEAFQYSRYKSLQFRLRMLARDTFFEIRVANPEGYEKIKSVLKSKATSSTLNDLTIGASLAIEAYQIDTGKNLLKGFGYLDRLGIAQVTKGFNSIPANANFSSSILDQVPTSRPATGHLALVEDVQLIGELTVDNIYNPLAMRSGAGAAIIALRNVWPHLYSPELPSYEPSRYKADSIL